MTYLLPCPFCGGSAERIDVPADDGVDDAGGSCIQCSRCMASTALHFDRKENLVSAWNQREAAPPAPTKPREEDWLRCAECGNRIHSDDEEIIGDIPMHKSCANVWAYRNADAIAGKPRDEAIAAGDGVEAYYAAIGDCLGRYYEMAAGAERRDLVEFIDQLADEIALKAPLYKMNRWLGYIQGVLIEIGCTDVLSERDWSRPLFRPLDYADGASELTTLRESVAALEAECLMQWRSNHFERCGLEDEDGTCHARICQWPLPEILSNKGPSA